MTITFTTQLYISRNLDYIFIINHDPVLYLLSTLNYWLVYSEEMLNWIQFCDERKEYSTNKFTDWSS